MNKTELVEALDAKLKHHASTYSANPTLREYYSHRANSPVKREPSSSTAPPATAGSGAAADTETKPKPRRRQTNVTRKDSADALLPAGTPRSIQQVASRVPLPSSPVAVTNFVERTSERISRRFSTTWTRSRIPQYATATRRQLSSSHGIAVFCLALEAMALRPAILPMRFAFSVSLPFAHWVGVQNPIPVSFPDFFVMLTSIFWSPFTLWLSLSLLAPAALGWLFNLTQADGISRRHHYTIDPLAFNVAKGVLAWMALERGWGTQYLFSLKTAKKVSFALYGGATGLEIGAGIGVLVGLYEAILRK